MWQVQNFKDDYSKKWLATLTWWMCHGKCHQGDNRFSWATWVIQCVAKAMCVLMYSTIMTP